MNSKQIDLIKKLIRLANNNPNENEANLAARKVCSMLADYEFKEVRTAADKIRSASNPVRYDNSWVHNVYKSTESYEKSPINEDFFKDFFRGFKGVDWNEKKQRKPANPSSRECPKCKSPMYFAGLSNSWGCSNISCKFTQTQAERYASDWDKQTWKPPEARPEQRTRTCSKCNKEVLTRRVTSVFTCDQCEWTAYQAAKGESMP